MNLPPQPSPSGIEVTHEDDPLTMEWRILLGSTRRKWTVGVWLIILALGLAPWAIPAPPALYVVFGIWSLIATGASVLNIVKLTTTSGDARLVLHPDSLIWVPGGGSIPQVFRKSEIQRVQRKGGRVILSVENEPGSGAKHLPLRGRFAPGDAAWLGDILERWRSGKLFDA